VTAAIRLVLAALAYGSSALATAVTLSVVGHGGWGWLAAAWFATAYAVVWGASGGKPVIPAAVRRGADLLALAVMVWFVSRVIASREDGSDWRPLAPLVLVAAQMIRAFVVTTPGEAESFLATGFALALYCATQASWVSGALFLSAFMWLWLAAMTLVQVLVEGERRTRAGGLVAATADPFRTLRSGLWLSLLVVGLGVGGFLVIRGPASGRGPGEGAETGSWSASGSGGSRYTTAVTFASQAGSRGPATELYRIRSPRSVARFRLQAFDTYTAEGWSLSRNSSTALPEGSKVPVQYALGLGVPAGVEGEAVSIEVATTGAEGDALLTAGWPLEFDGEFPGAILTDEEGAARLAYPFPPGFRYGMRTWLPAWDRLPLAAVKAMGADRVGERYLALPPGLPVRVGARAGEWSGGAASAWGRALNLAGALRANRKYQLDLSVPPSGGTSDPVEFFIFDATAGNCVNFASAFAVLCRAVGVPSRLVVGYLAHRWDESKAEWTVTSRDAHAWCEIALEGVGWVPVDPVPPARIGETAVGGTETPAPSSAPVPAAVAPPGAEAPAPRFVAAALRAFAAVWPWLLLGGAGAWLSRAGWRVARERFAGARRTRRAAGEIQRAFQRVCEVAGRNARLRREAQTPAEYARSLRSYFPALAADLVRLADLATEAEFSGERPTAQVRAEAKDLGRRLILAIAKGRP